MSIHRLMAKSPFRVLSLTTLRGVFPTIGSASDTLAQFRGLAISLRAPSGDYLIANSPFRHLQEPWHDAAPLRSPRLCPDPPPPPVDLAGRRSRCALGQPSTRAASPGSVVLIPHRPAGQC